ALEALYEKQGALAELASVLERRLARGADPAQERTLRLRLAELATELGDRQAAIGAWRSFIETYGPSHEAHSRLASLREAEHDDLGLARLLESESKLIAVASERAKVLFKLGQVRQNRLDDPAGALDAYAEVLRSDPSDKAARAAIDRMLKTAPVG